jgi:formiminotetrahydrofolate cyclodeaminase
VELLSLPTAAFLDRVAGKEPTPGGGSAAALVGALAAALAEMVAGMSKTRTGAADERQRLDVARLRAHGAGARLRRLVEEDSAAFDEVMGAYKLPKETDAQQDERRLAIDRALRRATDVPLATAEACLDVMTTAESAARDGNPNALSDARAGAALAWAGALGALENVRINTKPDGWGRPALERADAIQSQALVLAKRLKLIP